MASTEQTKRPLPPKAPIARLGPETSYYDTTSEARRMSREQAPGEYQSGTQVVESRTDQSDSLDAKETSKATIVVANTTRLACSPTGANASTDAVTATVHATAIIATGSAQSCSNRDGTRQLRQLPPDPRQHPQRGQDQDQGARARDHEAGG